MGLIRSSPVFFSDLIYFGAYNGCVYCLDAESGEVVWSSLVSDCVGSSPHLVPSKNLLIIGTEYSRAANKGGMAALDLETGCKLWEHPLRFEQHGSAEYWEEGELVVFGSCDGTLTAISAEDGRLVWELTTGGRIKYPPKISGAKGIVACAGDDGVMRVVSLSDGVQMHSTETEGICYTTPLIYGDRIFFGSTDTCLYVTSVESGDLLERIPTSGKIFSEPLYFDGNVIFGTTNGILEEICADTLQTRGAYLFPDAIVNKVTPTSDGRSLIVPTVNNRIFSISRTDGNRSY